MLRTATFAIDGGALLGPFEGYTTGDRWNGWATSYFEKPAADAIMAACNAPDFGNRVTYDPTTDTYTYEYLDPDDGTVEEDHTETYIGADHTLPDGTTVHLYGIGAYCWTWDEEVG